MGGTKNTSRINNIANDAKRRLFILFASKDRTIRLHHHVDVTVIRQVSTTCKKVGREVSIPVKGTNICRLAPIDYDLSRTTFDTPESFPDDADENVTMLSLQASGLDTARISSQLLFQPTRDSWLRHRRVYAWTCSNLRVTGRLCPFARLCREPRGVLRVAWQ